MKPNKWQTIISGGVYGDSDTGSDIFGDGSPDFPYETCRKCLESGTERPSVIILRGKFTEDLADGNHACTIRGDYMGAATFDGNDTYLIYGYTHTNMIIQNCAPGNSEMSVWSGSGLLAGAGRAYSAGYVGNAFNVFGVAGSPVICHRTGLYMGVAGGISAVKYNVFSKIKPNSSYPVSLGFRSGNLEHNTFYGVPITDRRKRLTSYTGIIYTSIFGLWDFFADDAGIELNGCLITSDCKFYYNGTEIPVTGSTSTDRHNSLIAGMDSAGVPADGRMVFVDCIFTTLTADEVMNNPEAGDFTPKIDSPAAVVPGVYIGALPPALAIPIKDDSTGISGSWDENTAAGCLLINGDAICIDELSASMEGEILSKVITVNPSEININALFAQFASRFKGYHVSLNNEDNVSTEYSEGQILPLGFYIVKGTVVYDGQNAGDNSIVMVKTEGTTFSDAGSASTLLAIDDPNVENVLWLRETPMPYLNILASDGLEAGATYLNHGNENITYRSRTIAPGESFVAENSVDTFTASSGYEIGVMFDDGRVPSSVWIPARMWGEYFVWKSAGVIQYDADGLPISSGNYLSYQNTANGGYSDQIMKTIMNKAYFQLKVTAKKYR